MKVLIGNFHNSTYGGGELYTYQVSKAISNFADVFFVNEPNRAFFKENPDLEPRTVKIWSGIQAVDFYVNINHFEPLVCNTAHKNIGVVLFPNKEHKVFEYDNLVAICGFSAKWAKEYWGRGCEIIQPYSKDLKALPKVSNTIVSIGNFFMEPDGHSKNQHLLIDAFKSLGDGWKLRLVGGVVSETYLNSLKQASEGLDVEILPNLSTTMKDQILATSEFYWHANGYGRLVPYQTEHFGIAAEEALKSGCLTYVHNSGGCKDFCTAWDTIPELVRMTKDRAPNKSGVIYNTKENMQKQWETILA